MEPTRTAPTTLGNYEVLRQLAKGGMADLLLARGSIVAGYAPHVVIKRIRAEQARDQRFVQMFLDEARLAAALSHPHIVQVHSSGQVDGEYFFAMEYVHGEDLRKLLVHVAAREQYIPLDHVLAIGIATAGALHYAHEHTTADGQPLHIVHRDVSPANILVGYDGNVKVVDFGIAKAAMRTFQTQSGMLKGKVAYMSPEQCVGQPVDRRSDIFSLGVVLYELLTVRRLFKAANDFLTMSAITHGEIPPPTTIRPGLPRVLESIVMKALAPHPDDRFQSADELRAALEAFALANNLQLSATALAGYMRRLFGDRPEPWLVDDDAELAAPSLDFDPSATGVVEVPAAALRRFAVPATTPVRPDSPLMNARTKAITGAQPVRRDAAADEIDHSVGDQTMMVRPVRRARGGWLALAVLVLALAAGVVIVAMRSGARPSAPPAVAPARELRAPSPLPPPPSSPPPSPPVVIERPPAAAQATDTDIGAPARDAGDAGAESANEASPEPGTLVKLRDNDPPVGSGTGTKKVRRKRGTRPPADEAPADTSWDPTALFPEDVQP